MKYRDLKEIYAPHIRKSSFERVFPLQQSCDWTILPDAIRIMIFIIEHVEACSTSMN